METKTTIIDAMNAHTDAKAAKEITDVIFLIDKPERDLKGNVFAFFPKDDCVKEECGTCWCYAHVGQHSPCAISYAKECKKATPEQYNDLKMELEGIGYNLNILKSI